MRLMNQGKQSFFNYVTRFAHQRCERFYHQAFAVTSIVETDVQFKIDFPC